MSHPLDAAILAVVYQQQRRLPPGRGVLPKHVTAFLDVYRCEQTLRRDMARLAKEGKLERCGGDHCRRGYRIARDKKRDIMIIEVELDQIRTDGGTQFRVSLNQEKVSEYAALYSEGVKLGDLHAIKDEDGNLWLDDGFHRHAAAKQAGLKTVPVEVEPGTQRDAVLRALSANGKHGLPRTNDDKRKAVIFCLRDPELRKLSQHEIARLCMVSQAMVSKVNAELYPKPKKSEAAGSDDNGYQSTVYDTPEQVIAALDQQQRADLLPYLLRRTTYIPDSDLRKLYTRLGLITPYTTTLEWTPMAERVLPLLVDGDEWTRREIDLWRWLREAHHGAGVAISSFGVLRPLLEKLYEVAGWVTRFEAEMPYNWVEWLRVLELKGCVQSHKVAGPSGWDTREFWHIAAPGCELLGKPALPIGEPPTREQIQAQEKARDEAWRAAQREREAAQKLKLDPEKEAAAERRQLEYELDLRDIDSVPDTLAACEWLRFDEARTAQIVSLLRQIKALVDGAPVINPHAQQPDELEVEDVEAHRDNGDVFEEGDVAIRKSDQTKWVVVAVNGDEIKLRSSPEEAGFWHHRKHYRKQVVEHHAAEVTAEPEVNPEPSTEELLSSRPSNTASALENRALDFLYAQQSEHNAWVPLLHFVRDLHPQLAAALRSGRAVELTRVTPSGGLLKWYKITPVGCYDLGKPVLPDLPTPPDDAYPFDTVMKRPQAEPVTE